MDYSDKQMISKYKHLSEHHFVFQTLVTNTPSLNIQYTALLM